MNLWTFIRNAFRSTPKLRNRAGGMAWINASVDEGVGNAVLIGRVVRTVRVTEQDWWLIDPPQEWIVKAPCIAEDGTRTNPGDLGETYEIRDDCLTPIPGDLLTARDYSEALGFYDAPKVREGV